MRINAYWFISLVLSLSAALIAILGKQWVREFERSATNLPLKEVVGVRQLKFEGLEYWRVGDIISALPLLLQLSLALFALGILELLWYLHVSGAIAVCVPTAIVLLFYLATTFLPLLQHVQRFREGHGIPQCAYKSPQALLAIHVHSLVVRLYQNGWWFLYRTARRFFPYDTIGWLTLLGSTSYKNQELWECGRIRSWNVWDAGFFMNDRHFPPPNRGAPYGFEGPSPRPIAGISHFRGLHWLISNMDESSIKESAWNCLWDEAHSTDTHPKDEAFRQNSQNGLSRIKHGLLHGYSLPHIRLANASLQHCAILSAPRTNLAAEFIAEIFFRNLPTMDVRTVEAMLIELSDVLSESESQFKMAELV
ncbi:hypothetical protein AURDEDRAFT_166718 [Auricularia subglabra TFB-10046 SS5]|nr:hypothetical protein AURDEDRAFT_166718 [Auricularia subglabra TFB-10046 SS5]